MSAQLTLDLFNGRERERERESVLVVCQLKAKKCENVNIANFNNVHIAIS